MFAVRMHRILIAWSAMLAILFGALAPSLAHALAAGGAEGIAVCGSTGMFVLNEQAPSSDTDDPANPRVGQQHCVWCAVHADMAAPVQFSAAPLPRRAQAIPSTFYRVGHVSALWRKALSRAPPLA